MDEDSVHISTEESEKDDTISTGGDQPSKSVASSGAFSKVTRQLTDNDLKNPAIGRMLLDERDRLLQENRALEVYKDEYYKADKRADVCEAVNGGSTRALVLSTIAQTLGGAIFGAAFSFMNHPVFWLFIVIGLILSVGAIAVSFVKNQK